MKESENHYRSQMGRVSSKGVNMVHLKYEKQKFGNEVFDWIVDWIASNLAPEDVFQEEILDEWAEANNYEKER